MKVAMRVDRQGRVGSGVFRGRRRIGGRETDRAAEASGLDDDGSLTR